MLRKIVPPPGINRDNTDYVSEGRWIDAQWVRFVGGLPEKMLGWQDFGFSADYDESA